jgi:site-specific DNA recombinase
VRGDRLEQVVWDRVRAVLESPSRVADEYRRRVSDAQNTATKVDETGQLDRQMATLRRGIGRLIDSYAEGVIDRAEFEPRIAGLKARLARLQTQRQTAAEAAEAERELTLVIGHLEEFAGKVRHSLDVLDWYGQRDIIRTLVRRIEIDGDRIEIVFRIPLPPEHGDPTKPASADRDPGSWQHCTGESRENLRLVRPKPAAEQGL